MELMFERAAFAALRRMPADRAEALVERLEKIAIDPFAHHPNVKRMQGSADEFRLRQGAVRAVYKIDRAIQRMLVVKIAPRGEVYR